MSRRSALILLLFLTCAFLNLAVAQYGKSGPLTCHKDVCPLPTSACQTLESDKCVKGRCPAIINAAEGTACDDGNVCTSSDVCTSGVCGGTAVVCSSPTDRCIAPSTGCATPCGAGGCTVDAAGGYGNPTLTIPPGALSSNIAISMVDQGGDPNNSSVFHVYSFSPSGTTFSSPATLDLPAPFLAAGWTAVIETSSDGATWTPIPTTLNNGRVGGQISHFSFCRTRSFVSHVNETQGLNVVDMYNYLDIKYQPTNPQYNPSQNALVIPPLNAQGQPEPGSCNRWDDFGVCFKIQNKTTTAIIPDPTCTASSTSSSCRRFHIVPWQCYTSLFPFPSGVPSTDPTYEGAHCNFTGLIIPCGDSIYNLDPLLPAAGLAPAGQAGDSAWIDVSFFGAPPGQTIPQPVNTVYPYSCYGSTVVGVDLLFREPSGSDWQAGMRSAKDGPCIEVPSGTTIFQTSQVTTCTTFLPAGQWTCCGDNFWTNVCSSPPPNTTCRASWDSLANHIPANYPTLRTTDPNKSPIKNWLSGYAF